MRVLHHLARLRPEHGGAAIELAIVGPVLALAVIYVADLSLGFFSNMRVQSAAQAGAHYAILHGFNAAAIGNAVVNSTAASVSASPAPASFCACPNAAGLGTVSCTSTCPGGASPGTYVRVTAQGSYSTIFNLAGLPSSMTQTAVATVRIQ